MKNRVPEAMLSRPLPMTTHPPIPSCPHYSSLNNFSMLYYSQNFLRGMVNTTPLAFQLDIIIWKRKGIGAASHKEDQDSFELMKLRLTLNSWSFHVYFLSSGTTHMYHNTQSFAVFGIKPKSFIKTRKLLYQLRNIHRLWESLQKPWSVVVIVVAK